MISILVAALVTFGLGALWYSPMLFGARWMAIRGLDPDNMDRERMVGALVTAAVANLLGAASLHYVVHWIGINDWIAALRLGLLIGVGVFALSSFSDAVFRSDDLAGWLIEAGYRSPAVVVAVLILSGFRI